jgi:uncharacterized protein YraI
MKRVKSMKRYGIVLIVMAASLLAVQMVFAGDGGGSDAIVLNDATPGVDVVITPAPGTTGVVAVELSQASVVVVDSAGNTVFQMADARVHKLELRLAPASSSYTLTAERLPGVTQAYVRFTSQADLSQLGETLLVSQQPLGMQQSLDMPLTGAAPTQATTISIPADQQGTVQASFPGAPVTAQVVDQSGQVVATLLGGPFDGVSLVLDGGDYSLTLLNTNPAQETLANVEVTQALPSELDGMIPELVAEMSCSMTVNVASVNLRSGPGTGYSVIDYGFRNDQFEVGGMNADGSWVVIAMKDGGSAWVSRNTGTLTDACQNLTVYDIPYQAAPEPQIVVVQQPPTTVVAAPPAAPAASAPPAVSSPSFHESDEHEEHGDD